jgi:dephospho-CoA kinase
MIKVGLTGNIGSGKTTISKIFEKLGVPIYNSDEKSKLLLDTNIQLKEKLIEKFGNIYDNDKIDKKKFADIIFTDKDELEKANVIIHPFVKEDFDKWCDEQVSEYIIKESAIIFERNIDKYLDKVIVVYAPEYERIRRIMKRDITTIEDIQERIDAQLSDKEKNDKADFVILNWEGDVEKQVLEIHKKLIKND